MKNKSEARNEVLAHIKAMENDYIVLDDETIEGDFGWVFFYDSRKFHETGELTYAIAGNSPLIYERETGNIISTGTAYSLEKYLSSYLKTGDPHASI